MRGKWLNYLKMSGVSRDAPVGVQCLQKISSWMCPRLQLNRLRCYQAMVLVLTYFTYMTYHLTRKPISVVKSVLHQNCSALPPPPDLRPGDDQWCNWAPFNTSDANTLLGTLDSAFLFSYAGAMFVSGMVAERVDLRYFLSLGMLVSAVFCYLFGLGRTLDIHDISFYLLVQVRMVAERVDLRYLLSLGMLVSAVYCYMFGLGRTLDIHDISFYLLVQVRYILQIAGMVAKRVDLRYFLSLGMLVSAVFCYLFGLGRTLDIHDISFYLLVQAGAGIAQTTGWPGTVAIVGKWFGNAKKGLIFGLWNSHTSLGNILGTLMAAKYVESDWALSFVYPALVMGVVGFLVFLFLAPEPRLVGLTPDRSSPSRQSTRSDTDEEPTQVIVGDQAATLRPSRHSANSPPYQQEDSATEETALLSRRSSRSQSGAVSLTRALAIPGVIDFSLSLFFAKLVSYTFLYWLPLYINSSTNLTPKQSGELSTAFDVGGVVGAALAGLLADYASCPALVCSGFYALCAPTLLAYQTWGATSYTLNVALLVAAGVLVNGPYALITTAVSAELGTHSSLAGDAKALATVTAIIDGTGSIGAAVGPMLAGLVSGRAGSWSYVFYMLIACDLLALLLLLRIAAAEVSRIRQERRLASPRLVRIE